MSKKEAETPITSTAYGTNVYVLGWKSKDLSHVEVEVVKNGFHTDIHLSGIKVTEEVQKKLKIS